MTNIEVQKRLREIFNDNAQIYSRTENRIELDVSKDINPSEWGGMMSEFKDYSKQIPNAWKCGDITIVLFNGSLNSYFGKKVIS